LKRKYEVNAKLYAYLLEKKAENDMIKVATISDYKIIEQAYRPLLPIKPRKPLVIILSLMLGLILGIILSLILNAMNSKIKTIADVKKYTALPIHGVIQFFRQKKFQISVFDNPQSDYAEGYRQLRTDLQFLSNSENKSQVILVSSMIKKEGKSTVLANLSAILQLSSVRVLVIDLNLRNPKLDNFFGKHQEKGVSAYLDGKVNLADIIYSTEHLNLDIIPVGSIPLNPSELLLSKKLERMLTTLRDKYDYILIDSTPLNSVTDTLLVMKHTDINLIVLRRNYAKKVFIKQLSNLVKKYKVSNIGIVFNGSTMNRKDEKNSYLEI
jgi:capsular exopolysaccharide synthesis family protein